MNLRPLVTLKKTLCFRGESDPHFVKAWPQALLPVAWQGELLCGFNATTELAWELSPNTNIGLVVQYFLELHPELATVDLLRIKNQSKDLPWGENFFIGIVRQLSKGQDSSWFKLFENLNLLPKELLNQWQQKRLHFGDLRPLISLELLQIEGPSWNLLTAASFSKSEWSQVIEWFTELLLMENNLQNSKPMQNLKTLQALEPLKNKPREFFLKLKELRYPETSKKDRLATEFWKKLPWPKNTQSEFRRQGDQTRTYVSMNFSSVKELKKLTEELHQMVQKQEPQQESEH